MNNEQQHEINKTIRRTNVESRALSIETRQLVTDRGIATMREILKNIPDYVVFASTAMYLQGHAKDIKDLKVLPGDFDAAVSTKQSLDHIRDLLANIPGIEFKNDGKYRQFPGEDSIVLSGIIPFRVETNGNSEEIEYEFEIFLNSRIVKKNLLHQQERLSGFNVLTLEGLKNQVLNNLLIESQLQNSATEVMKYLSSEIEPFIRTELQQLGEATQNEPVQPSNKFLTITDKLQLSPEDLINFYKEMDAYRQMYAGQDPEIATAIMSKILAGQKTKVKKREDNLRTLKDLV